MHSMRERCVCGGRLAPPLLFFSPSYLGQPLHPVHQAGQRRGVGRLGPQPQLRHVPDVGHKLGPDGGGQGAGGPEQGAQGGRGGRVHSPGGRVARVSERRHSFSLFFSSRRAPPRPPPRRARPPTPPPTPCRHGSRRRPPPVCGPGPGRRRWRRHRRRCGRCAPRRACLCGPAPARAGGRGRATAALRERNGRVVDQCGWAGACQCARGERERERGGRRKKQTRRHEKKSCIASQRPRPPLPHSRTHPTTRHDRPWPRRLPHHGLCR